MRVTPVGLFHLSAIGVDPGHILHLELLVVLPGQEKIAPQNRIFVTKAGQLLHESGQGLSLLLDVPIQPADFGVLTVRVVVAALSPRKLVTGKQHRRTL